ncbi:MAG: hypothetical protein KVP17_005179 [Porospora cf. gigantea B]|uniref:uncharacterized protein n=1 Tax=Porospora cf. gigantea B TaxID=2853592 RepID=UPI003571CFBC|nr:MAG: hypothetical protein KVP17_005179 [Porospora cf. gigantea B]
MSQRCYCELSGRCLDKETCHIAAFGATVGVILLGMLLVLVLDRLVWFTQLLIDESEPSDAFVNFGTASQIYKTISSVLEDN